MSCDRTSRRRSCRDLPAQPLEQQGQLTQRRRRMLRVPLHTSDRGAVVDDRFDDTIRSDRTYLESSPQNTEGLVMRTPHRTCRTQVSDELRGAETAGRGPHKGILTVGCSTVLRTRRYMLHQGAAASDIDNLRAAADAQERSQGGQRVLDHGNLVRIGRRFKVAAIVIIRRSTIKPRIHIIAAEDDHRISAPGCRETVRFAGRSSRNKRRRHAAVRQSLCSAVIEPHELSVEAGLGGKLITQVKDRHVQGSRRH